MILLAQLSKLLLGARPGWALCERARMHRKGIESDPDESAIGRRTDEGECGNRRRCAPLGAAGAAHVTGGELVLDAELEP